MKKNNILHICPYATTDVERTIFSRIDSSHNYVLKSPEEISLDFKKGNPIFLSIKGLLKIRRIIKEHNIDVIVSDNPRVGLPVALILKIINRKTKHIIWNFNIAKRYEGIKLLFSRFAINNVDIVVFSNHERIAYSEIFKKSLNSIHYKLYSGPYLEDARYQNLNKEKKEYLVSAGYSGRDYEKLFSLAKLAKDYTFIVVTKPVAIQGLEIPDNVKIVGGISEIEYCQYIANAKAFILPIKEDVIANGQIAVVQAMSFETPLIVNNLPGVSDYLIPNSNSLTINFREPEQALIAINDLLANERKSLKMAQNAKEFADSNFTIEKDVLLLSKIIDTYNQ